VLPLETLNEGFSDPQLISLAYHQASLVVEHLAARFGEPSLTTLLRAYGRGLETDAAFTEAFNVSIQDVQQTFDAALERDYGALRRALEVPEKGPANLADLKVIATANPGSFPVQMSLGRGLAEAGDSAGAIAAFERAAALVPAATGTDNPNRMIAAVALEQKDTPRAIAALEAVLRVDHADVDSARTLIELVEPLGNPARTQDAYQRLLNVDPFESTSHTALGRLALARKDTPTAIRAFRSALATSPPDRASSHVDLGEAYLQAARAADAKTQALAALEIAPSYERGQDLLLRLVEGRGLPEE
jgi:tetratricopeptide (TPR) repeat protein